MALFQAYLTIETLRHHGMSKDSLSAQRPRNLGVKTLNFIENINTEFNVTSGMFDMFIETIQPISAMVSTEISVFVKNDE